MMSIHRAVHPFLFTSITLIQPPSSAFQCCFSPPCSLFPLTYLHLLLLPLYLSACSTHSFYPLSVRNPTFTLTPSILPPLYNFNHMCQHPPCSLSLTFYTPPSASVSRPYLFSLTLCLISHCLSAALKYSKLNKQQQAPGDVCLRVGLYVSLSYGVSDREGAPGKVSKDLAGHLNSQKSI